MVDLADVLQRAHALKQSGDWEGAIYEMRRAVEAAPQLAALKNDLALTLRQGGRLNEAAAVFAQALAQDPALWQAHFNLGNLHRQAGRSELALACYQRALASAPEDVDTLVNLGATQLDLGECPAARASLERALQITPGSSLALLNLGNVAKAEGSLEQAIECYRRVLELDPLSASAHYNLGVVWRIYNQLEMAVAAFEQAVRLDPNHLAAWINLGKAYEAQADADAARSCFQRALALGADDGLRIKIALTIPALMEGQDQIEATRARLAHELRELSRLRLRVADPVGTVGCPNFALAYHGHDERATQEQVAHLLLAAAPDLAYAAPHCRRYRPFRADRLIKMGFISAHFRHHTIGKLNCGLIEQFDRRLFHVTVFRFSREEDAMSLRIAAAADTCVTLPPCLDRARDEIARHELDVLLYTDIGFDSLTYYLAFARLAPVQCVTWGHPLTTGISSIDYFISSHDLDPLGAEACYTEKLVRLNHLANYYFRPQFDSIKSRPDFGIPSEGHLYGSLQSLFKYHPDDDQQFASILRSDPHGLLVLLEGNYPSWTERIRRRLQSSIADVYDRIVFVPQQSPQDYARLAATVDVLLDPLHFGGGDTSYQSFAVGTPVVTLPGRFLRSRITFALYQAMGINDMIAADADEYVARAVRLGTDEAWRKAARARILAANHRIFENAAGVRDLEAFLRQALGAR